jgi:CspA family cold shock protein
VTNFGHGLSLVLLYIPWYFFDNRKSRVLMKNERTYVGGLMVSVAGVVALSFLVNDANPLLIAGVFLAGAVGGASLSGMMNLASPDRSRTKEKTRSSNRSSNSSSNRSSNKKVTGEVKWFRGSKGFGFIVPDAGGSECFVHRSAIEGGGSLSQGDRVEYELTTDAKGREAAEAVVKLSKK